MSDLWDYDNGDDEAQIHSSDGAKVQRASRARRHLQPPLPRSEPSLPAASPAEEEVVGSAKKRKPGRVTDTLEQLMPAEKRLKAQKLFGRAVDLADSPDARRGQAAPPGDDSDSDLEILAQAQAQAEAVSRGGGAGAGPSTARAAPAAARDSRAHDVHARARAALLRRQPEAREAEAEEDPLEGELSPVQLRHAVQGGARPAAAAAAAPAPAAADKAPKILLKLETTHNRSLSVRLRTTGKLKKAFETFRDHAVAQVCAPAQLWGGAGLRLRSRCAPSLADGSVSDAARSVGAGVDRGRRRGPALCL
jgi:hypothetical protein